MASLIVFLCFAAFMFAAGYHWRNLRQDYSRLSHTSGPVPPRGAVWDGMVGKL